jgi:hypothetical protein
MPRPGLSPFDGVCDQWAISGMPTSASVRMDSGRLRNTEQLSNSRVVMSVPALPRIALPSEVRDPAARLGVPSDAHRSSVTLTQRGTMRNSPTGRAMRFRAVQTINLRQPEFVWRATAGPLGCISVIDALANSEANLEVRAFRLLRIASVKGGAAVAKGEVMRYLAELAWRPTQFSAIHCLPGPSLTGGSCA